MFRIIRYLKKSWAMVLVIIGLFGIQAYCDLTLPQYTSDIVDIGISNNGIDETIPESIRGSELEKLKLFVSQDNAEIINASYEKTDETVDGDYIYELVLDESEELNQLVSIMEKPVAFLGMVESFSNGNEQDEENAESSTFDVEKIQSVIAEIYLPQTTNNRRAVLIDELFDSFGNFSETVVSSLTSVYIKAEYETVGIDMDKFQINYLTSMAARMILLCMVAMASAIAAGFLAARIAAGASRDIRNNLFSKVISFSNKEMDKFSTASLITRNTNDIQQIQLAMVMMLRIVVYAPIVAIWGIVKVVTTTYSMSWIIFVSVAAVLCVVVVLFTVAMPKFKLMQVLVDKVNLVAREILTGVTVIRAFSTEKHEEKRFDEANVKLMKTQLFTNRSMTFMMPVMMFIMNAVMVMIIWFGGKGIDTGDLKVGEMMAFMSYTMQIIFGFLMITMISIIVPRAAVSAKRIDEVLETETSVKDMGTKKSEENTGLVEFRNVNFRYPSAEEDVLSDISFTAKPGETTAIIGSTGSGKTTLVNLIPRFYDVTEGSILVDGLDLREMPQKYLRSKIGYVPQKGILFSGTIESNIKFGKNDATMDEVVEAAKISQAETFIMEKEGDYGSEISQGGTNVSGGQKQRISIARAIAKKPEVFIFDDSFSALDYKTDIALRKSLKEVVGESTVIIVAQRISTILNAEQIIVLDDGKIVGKGKHSELIKSCEVYRQIASSQLSEEEIKEVSNER